MDPQDRSSDRAIQLNSFANALQKEYEQAGDTKKLADAIDLHREALSLRPAGHPSRPNSLGNLANAFLTQYVHTGDVKKLEEAIDLHREALTLRPRGHPDRASSLCDLAEALRMRYEQTGDAEELSATTDLHQEALSLRPEGHPKRASSFCNFANALVVQYRQAGDVEKLTKATSLLREAVLLCPPGHPDRSLLVNNLASVLMVHYEQSGNTEDLTEVISLSRETLAMYSEGHPERGDSLEMLANALFRHYERTGDIGKLTEAVDLYRKALALQPEGHPERRRSLSHLAAVLHIQYEKTRDTDSLMESTEMHLEVLALRPPGHPDRGSSLNSLIVNYGEQFLRNGDESALVSALKLQDELLEAWHWGHPDRFRAHYSIARLQLLDSSLFDWEKALGNLKQAMMDKHANPRLRLSHGVQSLQEVERASARDIKRCFLSQVALDVYVEAIQLLRRTAHVGVHLSTHVRELSGSEQLYCAAAVRAALLEQLPTAIELLEEGKAVFWSQALCLQALRLYPTAFDDLPVADGERLRHLFELIDQESDGASADGVDKVILERHMEHQRQLADQAARLVEEIRARPGFGRFLRIPQYEKLSQAAMGNFVVALVASHPRYFAIVVQAEKAPQLVHLDSIDAVTLRRLIDQTSSSGMRDCSDKGVIQERVQPRVSLEQMWRLIVEPVVRRLGLSVCSDCFLFLRFSTHVTDRKPKGDVGRVCIGTLQATLRCCRYMPPGSTRATVKPVLQTTLFPRTFRHCWPCSSLERASCPFLGVNYRLSSSASPAPLECRTYPR
jgi:tetratricopeptide (TPR) repeat protein